MEREKDMMIISLRGIELYLSKQGIEGSAVPEEHELKR